MDDTKSYYQLIIKITISEKRKIAKLCDKGKFYTKLTKVHKFRSLYTVSIVIETKVVIDLNYNFEFDLFVELSGNKLSDNNLASELVGNRSFLNQSQLRKL